MLVEIQNYLIPYTCTNKQPYNVFLGFWGKYRSFWSGISDPGPQSISDQFPKIWFRSGQKVWTGPKMAGPSHPYITTSLFSLSITQLPVPLFLCLYPYALNPMSFSLCLFHPYDNGLTLQEVVLKAQVSDIQGIHLQSSRYAYTGLIPLPAVLKVQAPCPCPYALTRTAVPYALSPCSYALGHIYISLLVCPYPYTLVPMSLPIYPLLVCPWSYAYALAPLPFPCAISHTSFPLRPFP